MRLSSDRLQKALPIGMMVAGTALMIIVIAPGLMRVEPTDLPSEGSESDVPPPGQTTRSPFELAPATSKPLEYASIASDVESPSRGIEEGWQAGGSARSTGSGEADASSLPCLIEPHGVVEVGSPVTGLIESIPVERADFVDEGQVLVVLESRVEKAAVAFARSRAAMNEGVLAGQARLELGKRKYSRANQLFKSDTLSLDLQEEMETEVELAKLELRQARAEKKQAGLELEQARAVLDRRTIHSPFSGVVVERMMSPGERVEQETILKIAQIDPLRVEVILPSSMFGSIDQGAKATVVPEFPGDTVHVARVAIVDRIVDSASGTFGVQLHLPNPDHAIPGGVHCQVRFLDE